MRVRKKHVRHNYDSQKKVFLPLNLTLCDNFMFLIYHYHTHSCFVKFFINFFAMHNYFHLQFRIIIIIDSCTVIRCMD